MAQYPQLIQSVDRPLYDKPAYDDQDEDTLIMIDSDGEIVLWEMPLPSVRARL